VGRVRHFPGFAEDSDARVEECCCWRSFVCLRRLKNGCRRRRPLDSGLEKKGVSARVMNHDHSLIGCAALPGLKLLWGCLQTQAGLRRCPRRQGIIVEVENAPAASDLQTIVVSPRALCLLSSAEGRAAAIDDSGR